MRWCPVISFDPVALRWKYGCSRVRASKGGAEGTFETGTANSGAIGAREGVEYKNGGNFEGRDGVLGRWKLSCNEPNMTQRIKPCSKRELGKKKCGRERVAPPVMATYSLSARPAASIFKSAK